MQRAEEEDFDHPSLPEGHRLRRHVLYRLKRQAWLGRYEILRVAPLLMQ